MKLVLKQFTVWYNRARGRTGSVWSETSWWTPVEDDGDTLLGMATFIDLNPVQLGLASLSEDYRWCSFAEAMAGLKPAGAAVRFLVLKKFGRDEKLLKALGSYREQLYLRWAELKQLSATASH